MMFYDKKILLISPNVNFIRIMHMCCLCGKFLKKINFFCKIPTLLSSYAFS